MRRKIKSYIALLLTLSMFLATSPVMAEEYADDFYELNGSETVVKAASDAEAGVQEVLATQAEELEELTPGRDYMENEATFSANSREEAQEVADAYGATLSSFEEGVAVVEFDADVREALKEASESVSSDTVIVPNYILQIADYAYTGDVLEEDEGISKMADSVTPSDPQYTNQWFHKKINSESAWGVTSGNGVKVAVLDNGFYANHTELSANVVETYNASDGTTDVSPVTKESEKSHGTHVAGIIAAKMNNSEGGCGVAPSASLYLVKLSDSSGSMTIANLVKGINKAAEWKVEVINMSVGSSGLSYATIQLIQNAINNAVNNGAVVISAANNDGNDSEHYPAACENVISVASITSSNELASSSCYGDWVDFAAPGVNIYSTAVDNGYTNMTGTSMASPVVAGVAALIYSKNSSLIDDNSSDTALAVMEKLKESVDSTTYSSSDSGGSVTGCIDAAAAVDGTPSYSDTTAFYVKTSTGYLTKGGTLWITPGKKITLTVTDSEGNKIKAAAKKNATTYSLSNTTNFTLKNNKLNCLKNTDGYSGGTSYSSSPKTTVTVTYNGSSVKIKFVALSAIKKISCPDNGEKSYLELNVTQGSTVSLNSIYNFCGKYLYYLNKSGDKIGTVDDIGYTLTIPKNAVKNGTLTYGSDGNVFGFTPNKKGKYIFTVTAPAGVKKKFKIKVRVV